MIGGAGHGGSSGAAGSLSAFFPISAVFCRVLCNPGRSREHRSDQKDAEKKPDGVGTACPHRQPCGDEPSPPRVGREQSLDSASTPPQRRRLTRIAVLFAPHRAGVETKKLKPITTMFRTLSLSLFTCLFVLLGLFASATLQAADKPVKVFILAGQSNMEGKAPNALLEQQATNATTRELFAHLRKDGQWIVRDDVFIKFLDRHGPLTIGYGSRDRTGAARSQSVGGLGPRLAE